MPKLLKTLVKWIILGPSIEVENEAWSQEINVSAENIAQIIQQATKQSDKFYTKQG